MISADRQPFNIAVCGAGIAGLCAGIGLAQQGHNVTILESAHELLPIGIGLHLPPNATLVLKHFGLLERLATDAIYPSTFALRRWDDNKILGSTPEHAFQSSGDGTPYWTIKRSDYQRHLYNAAIESGCNIRLGVRVTTIDADVPSVNLDSGEVIVTDLIVAADGIKSNLREMLIPEDDVSIVNSRFSSFRCYLNEKDLISDPQTLPSFKDHPTNTWLGFNRHVFVYPCGGGLCTLSAICPAKGSEAMEWHQSATVEEVQKEFEAWKNPAVDRVLSYAKDVKKWRLAEVPPLPRWTSKSGKAVLVGDAAHAMFPTLAQGAAMATEDAFALAECIGRAKSTKDFPVVLKAFERSRKWRCEIVQAQSRRNNDVLHVADGVEQEERDRKMAGVSYDRSFWEVDIGPMVEPDFLGFLHGHDVMKHTREILASMSL